MQASRVRAKQRSAVAQSSGTASASSSATASSSAISIKGSTKIVTEFFDFSVNTILYQRNIYPAEDFKMVKKYGLNMLVSTDDSLQAYLKKIMAQLNAWLLAGKVSRLVLAIISKETREVVERWQFDVSLESQAQAGEAPSEEAGKENEPVEQAQQQPPKKEKTEKEIHQEIQAIIRQITASVTFLPVIEEKCSFNILVYTGTDTQVPIQWQDSNAHLISGNAEQVKLRSFSTSVHKVDSLVAYRLGDD